MIRIKSIDKNILQLQQLTHSLSNSLRRFVASPVFFWITIIWFAVQALYIAYSTRYGIPPDEVFHVPYIRMFANGGLSPFLGTQDSYFNLGEVTRSPFMLYPYLLSFPYRLLESSPHVILFLRVINIFMAIGSLFVVRKISKVLKFSELVTNLSLFMLGNTLMFIFLSTSVNYDNLFILLSLTSILLLLLIIERFTAVRFLLLTAVLLAGAMVKLSFLPLAAIVSIILVWNLRIKLAEIPETFLETFKDNKPIAIIISACVVLLLTLFSQRYIVNIVQYGTPIPSCTKVLTIDQCRLNKIFARDERIANTKRPAPDRDTLEFAVDWSLLMQDRTYGIFSHKQAEPTALINVWSEVIIVISFIAFIKMQRKSATYRIILTILGFYTLVLFYTNFKTYQSSGSFGFAVQGRYLFPALPIIYLIANDAILRWSKKAVTQAVYIMITLCVFLSAGLPSYVFSTTPEWHNKNAVGINKRLKDLLFNIRVIR